MNKLQGKVAVITGGSSGIGLETARLFVQEGAKVAITGRNQQELDKAAKSIGSNVMKIQADVSQLSDLDKMTAQVKEAYGKIDILFANAGIASFASVTDATEAHFDSHFDINVKGLFFTVQKLLPLIKNGGSIIVNSSVAGFTAAPGLSVYSATKAAVRSFARTWSLDLKERQIRVNSISPGPIETPIFNKMGLTENERDQFIAHILGDSPLGRMGTPNEVAKALLFLASDDSSYVTGINLCVDGGLGQI